MTALRELAERWKADSVGDDALQDYCAGLSDARGKCADELLSILDADGEAVGETVSRESAMDAISHVEQHNGPGRASQARAMLQSIAQPARSGVVSDEDVRRAYDAAWEIAGESRCWLSKRIIRAAIEHFAKSQRSVSDDVRDAERYRWLRDNGERMIGRVAEETMQAWGDRVPKYSFDFRGLIADGIHRAGRPTVPAAQAVDGYAKPEEIAAYRRTAAKVKGTNGGGFGVFVSDKATDIYTMPVYFAAAPVGVPDGMVVVPIYPTEAMQKAGGHVNSEWLNDSAPIGESRYTRPMIGVWDAMLAAAPPSNSPTTGAIGENG